MARTMLLQLETRFENGVLNLKSNSAPVRTKFCEAESLNWPMEDRANLGIYMQCYVSRNFFRVIFRFHFFFFFGLRLEKNMAMIQQITKGSIKDG